MDDSLRMRKTCPGCNGSLVHHGDGATPDSEVFRWCRNAQCPLRSRCPLCRNRLEPITEPVPCARARCMTESCSRFGWEVDDNWPERYAA